MDVIFKLMIVFGLIELVGGVITTVTLHSFLASIRRPPSIFAGTEELIFGALFLTIGLFATRAWNKR